MTVFVFRFSELGNLMLYKKKMDCWSAILVLKGCGQQWSIKKAWMLIS